MKRVQIQLTEQQLANLEIRASRSNQSVAATVREAVDHWLADDAQAARIERALQLAGGFHSGLGDLAENHDSYLAEDE